MDCVITRRSVFLQAAAAPLLAGRWQAGEPKAYLAELAKMMRAAPVPGAVIGVTEKRKMSWIAPLGVQVAGGSAPVTADTLFQAASLSKQVTAYAAFTLQAQGKLDFDRTLVSYVDDLANAKARTVTVRQALSHSSGFPNWRQAKNQDLEPEFEPGSKFRYSGEGYFYLQRVLEQVSGTGFGELVSRLVFEPLGMKSSGMVWEPSMMARTAAPHNGRGEVRQGWDQRYKRIGREARYAEYSAGGGLPNGLVPNGASSLVTSANDYAKFVAAAIQNPEIARQQVRINEFLGWGLGWAVENVDGRTFVWQWGDNPGYKNFVMAEPAAGNAVFVFTNGDAGQRIYDRAVTHVTGRDHPALFWL